MAAVNWFEIGILHWIEKSLHTPFFNAVMPVVSSLGNAGWFWILVSLALLIGKKTRNVGLAMAFALAFSLVVANITLKPLVSRIRPFDLDPTFSLLIAAPKDFSFPSGHTQASFAAATALFFHRRRAGLVALILAVVISFSRLYLCVHFPSDVLAGMIIGVGLGFLAATIADGMRHSPLRKRDVD